MDRPATTGDLDPWLAITIVARVAVECGIEIGVALVFIRRVNEEFERARLDRPGTVPGPTGVQ